MSKISKFDPWQYDSSTWIHFESFLNYGDVIKLNSRLSSNPLLDLFEPGLTKTVELLIQIL